jgi:IMP cyclohydrolase
MDCYEIKSFSDRVKGNSYVGRGIVVGTSPSGKYAVFAYFIMGRSSNSRNRVFVNEGKNVTIYPFDPSKVDDPSLIIYSPIREIGNKVIVTNGDQTDTIYDFVKEGKTFEEALDTRTFEPDAPNFTPRISAIMNLDDKYTYKMNICKSIDKDGTDCQRFTYSYPCIKGLGHFIHTYQGDGKPLPTFFGECERVEIPEDMKEFAEQIWSSLDNENKISLCVRYYSLEDKSSKEIIYNKNKGD